MVDRFPFIRRATFAAVAAVFIWGGVVWGQTDTTGNGTGTKTDTTETPGGPPYFIDGKRLDVGKEPIPGSQVIRKDGPTAEKEFLENGKRILFPVNVDGNGDGFYGFIDCYEENGFYKGPVVTSGADVSFMFSASDFEQGLKKAPAGLAGVVLDIKQLINGEGIERKLGTYAGRSDGDNNGGLPIITYTLTKFVGKYPTIELKGVNCAWSADGFIIRGVLISGIPVNKQGLNDIINWEASFIIIDNGVNRFLSAPPATAEKDKTASKGIVIEGTGPNGVIKNKWPIAFTVPDTAQPFPHFGTSLNTPPGSSSTEQNGRPILELGEEKGKTITICLKLSEDVFSRGYVISHIRLYDGRIVSAENSEFDSTLLYETNINSVELKRLVRDRTKIAVSITEDNGKRRNVGVMKAEVINTEGEGNEEAGRLLLVIDKQIRDSDTVTITRYAEPELLITAFNFTKKPEKVTGVPFKDERNVSIRTTSQDMAGAKSARAVGNFKYYWPIKTSGRFRISADGDLTTGNATSPDFFTVSPTLLSRKIFAKRPNTVIAQPNISGLVSWKVGDVTQMLSLGGDIGYEWYFLGKVGSYNDNVWRLELTPAFSGFYAWHAPRETALSPNDRYQWRGDWLLSIPGNLGLNLNGGGAQIIGALYVIPVNQQTDSGLKNQFPYYIGLKTSFGTKPNKETLLALDSQAPIDIVFVYELGRKPPDFEFKHWFNFGFEYARDLP